MNNRQKTISKAVTTKTGAYTANDVVGGLLTFDVSNPGGSGTIRAIRIVDDDAESAALTIYWFSTAPSAILDDAAFAPTVADLQKMCGIVTVNAAEYVTINSNTIAIKGNLTAPNVDFVTTDGNIYAYIVCTATPTYTAATDLTIICQFYLDG